MTLKVIINLTYNTELHYLMIIYYLKKKHLQALLKEIKIITKKTDKNLTLKQYPNFLKSFSKYLRKGNYTI